ncbi:XRE family transcriptional regulator [Sinomicrobium pectinilyticum]|uniref:XRE family transcriptional regulator n=1 Tax=Sinomicrobium pectinilyticum TaxID=1084421 RepID=A0A3N0EFQ2_SINP1|nr:helix-turn-helix transcriptional regulator [Sinomicrobium pectinilyticum]RNL86685.1 XRE family transcriptional regulator [Sinomicrobium pectinilyticum]
MNTAEKNHIGRKIGRIRELKGIKQLDLAERLGISQQTLSRIEQSETVEDEKLKEVAQALGVTKEAIENFSEDKALNIIGNTYHVDNSSAVNYGCTFNPLDKLMEVVEENKRLYKELLKAEKDKVKYLEKLLKEYKK